MPAVLWQHGRPDVDKINGLSPVISIEQKQPRETPLDGGTVTEIYDFMRLLLYRAGGAFSYLRTKMVRQSEDQIINNLIQLFQGKIDLLAPVVRGRKGHYRTFVQIPQERICQGPH